MDNLQEEFGQYFDVVSADTVRLMEAAYRLRYQVYCEENAYEEPGRFPEQMETDDYDLHSPHSMIKCRASGHYTGLVRLVLADPVDPERPFPMECLGNFDSKGAGVDLSGITRTSIGEISRFAISRSMRSTCANSVSIRTVDVDDGEPRETSGHGQEPRKMTPHMILGLFAGIVRMSAQHKLTHWLAVMEPTLLRFLTRFGIHFQPLGPLVDYHGMRQPAIGVIDEVLAGIYASRKDVWEFITENGRIWPLGGDALYLGVNNQALA